MPGKVARPAHVVVGVHQRDERTLGAPSEYAMSDLLF